MEKKIINISNSIWSKKVYKKITIGQLLSVSICLLITLAVTILLIVFTQSAIWSITISLLMIFLLVGLNVKQCFMLKILVSSTKWLFSKKTRITKNIISENGIIKTKHKKYAFFEINCAQLVGSEIDIERRINDVIDKFSKFVNWSIINTQLPFNDLDKNKEWIQQQKEEYLKTHIKDKDDAVFKNIVTNEYLINSFINGDIQKNTYLFCVEMDLEDNITFLYNEIKSINQQLSYQNFGIKIISNEIMNSVNENLFLFNKKIVNKINHIVASDEYNNKQYYHFFKINSLPNIVNESYLDFLNSIELKNAIINFSINTYGLKNYKKEEKIWNNAIKNVEYELDRAFKYRDKIQAEHNWDAILEINSDLIQNSDTTQKFEIICSVISSNKRDLVKASYRAKQIIKKANQFLIDHSHGEQFNLFYNFQRNILGAKLVKKTLNILPNNLILFSYPFQLGNNYLNSGWFTGQLFNGNPLFLNLNSGSKQNNSSLIIGKTGSGKSTFINLLIKNNMSSNNVKTILFDPKGEYGINEEVKSMNPKIISLANDKDLSLNPFELSYSETDANKINSMLSFFQIWFNDSWNDRVKNYFTNALQLCLSEEKWNFEVFYEKLLQKIPQDFEDRKLIIQIIGKLLPGKLYGYFSQKMNMNLDNKLIIFDLNELLTNLNDLNKAKLMLVFKFLKTYIYKKDKLDATNEKIQIIVDEFPAIAAPTAPFVVTEFVSLIRLIRSYDASLILTMQDIVRLTSNDANSNESLKSVANNVEHKFIMNMNSEQLEIMKNIWGDSVELSPQEEYQITTKFAQGDILYINKANRYYLNSTDPNSKWSPFSQKEINNYFLKEFEPIKEVPHEPNQPKPEPKTSKPKQKSNPGKSKQQKETKKKPTKAKTAKSDTKKTKSNPGKSKQPNQPKPEPKTSKPKQKTNTKKVS